MSQTASAESPPRHDSRQATLEHDGVEPRSKAGRRVSEQTYWDAYNRHPDFHYEWNNGVLEGEGQSCIIWYESLRQSPKLWPVKQAFG